MPKNKKVLRKLDDFSEYKPTNKTKHADDRKSRIDVYETGNFMDAFVVDTYHKDGLEVHIVDDLGYIHIFNKDSKKFITVLSGRPAQLVMYYSQLFLPIPRKAISIAVKRNEEGYNEI
jgi:hypothetical protein